MTLSRVIALLTASVLAASAATAPAQQGNGRENAPGQLKKQETVAPEAAPTPASEPTATVAPEPVVTAQETSTRSASAGPQRSARGAERANPRARDVVTEQPATPATADPAPAPAPAAEAPAPARQATGTSRTRERRARARRENRRTPAPAAPAVHVAPTGGSAAPQPAPVEPTPVPAEREPARDTASGDDVDASADLDRFDIETRPVPAGPITEFVEVVPEPLRSLLTMLAVLSLVSLAGFMGVSSRARRIERRRRNLSADVGLLQSALLPELPAHVGPVEISAAYRPSDGPAAGGDFYDAFALDGHRTCVLVGDVAGHGRDALPLTAAVRFTVRAHLEAGASPRKALALAGRALEGQLRGRLVTVVAAVYDARTGELTYACAGHPAPVLPGVDPLREVAGSPPFGAGAPTGRRSTVIGLQPGSVVCFHTDGLFDVRVRGGRLGPEGLAEAIEGAESAADVLARVTKGSMSQPDDMAAVMLRIPARAAAPRTARREILEVDADELAGPRPRRFLAALGVPRAEAEQMLAFAAERVATDGTTLMTVTPGESNRLTNTQSV